MAPNSYLWYHHVSKMTWLWEWVSFKTKYIGRMCSWECTPSGLVHQSTNITWFSVHLFGMHLMTGRWMCDPLENIAPAMMCSFALDVHVWTRPDNAGGLLEYLSQHEHLQRILCTTYYRLRPMQGYASSQSELQMVSKAAWVPFRS